MYNKHWYTAICYKNHLLLLFSLIMVWWYRNNSNKKKKERNAHIPWRWSDWRTITSMCSSPWRIPFPFPPIGRWPLTNARRKRAGSRSATERKIHHKTKENCSGERNKTNWTGEKLILTLHTCWWKRILICYVYVDFYYAYV